MRKIWKPIYSYNHLTTVMKTIYQKRQNPTIDAKTPNQNPTVAFDRLQQALIETSYPYIDRTSGNLSFHEWLELACVVEWSPAAEAEGGEYLGNYISESTPSALSITYNFLTAAMSCLLGL
jgi:hypothetical protein